MSFEDQPHFTSNFDNLLDMSSINNSVTFHDISDKFGFSEKERTREQSYEQINKQVNQAKIQQAQLRHQLAMLKKSTFRDYLGRFQEEIDQLNHENQILRKELKDVSCKKIEDKRQRMSNRSSIRVRNSVNSVIGDQNKRTHTKTNRKVTSPNMILKKKQAKLTESSAFLGRSQVQSPHHHKRRQSQLTQRKLEQNSSEVISFNNSIDDRERAGDFGSTGCISKQYLQPQGPKNIFVEILEKMLKEEVALDHQKYSQIYLESTRPQIEIPKQDPIFINAVEKEIKDVNSKLQMLGLVANRYQSQIQEMNINTKNVSSMFEKLYEVKGKYVAMEKRCQELGRLRKQVKSKEEILASKREQMEKEKDESKTITSVQTLIKIFTNNPNKTFPMHHTQLYSTYSRQLKQIFKFDKEDQTKQKQKSVKVKELIDTIRLSRKKFNELIQIYEARIAKVEQKIGRVLKMQSQSAKSSQK